MDVLRPEDLPEQTIQVLVKAQGETYQVLCPLAMVQVLPALVQAELFRAQVYGTLRQAPRQAQDETQDHEDDGAE